MDVLNGRVRLPSRIREDMLRLNAVLTQSERGGNGVLASAERDDRLKTFEIRSVGQVRLRTCPKGETV